MASSFVFGRAGQASVITAEIRDLPIFLRKASQLSPDFNKQLRIAAEDVAEIVVVAAKQNAAGQPRHGKTRPGSSGRSQAQAVVDGLRARRDRIPTIKLDDKRGFVSASRPNRKRKKKATMGDVFFGAEFGGRRRPTTQQFLRHRGRQGYFFWQAVRDNRERIAREYLTAIDRVLKELGTRGIQEVV
jgi:hypothetical protein